MLRRNSEQQQLIIRALQTENRRLTEENNTFRESIRLKNQKLLFYSDFKNGKRKELARLKTTAKFRWICIVITFLIIILCWMCISSMEEKDHTLLSSSSKEICHLIQQQIDKFINSPQAKCIALVIIFNFIICIICQMTFPCPKLLFCAILLQVSISVISIIIPDFIVIIIFSVTCWTVPIILLYDADKAVSFVWIYIYIYIYI